MYKAQVKAGRATVPHVQAGQFNAIGCHLTGPVSACLLVIQCMTSYQEN